MNIWDDIQQLTAWHDMCDPERRPAPDQYVDFDTWIDDGPKGRNEGLRGVPFVGQAIGVIRLRQEKGSSCQLMTGFRGAGKSTELSRLATELKRLGFAVVEADARNYDNFTRAHTIEDLILVLAASIGKASDSHQVQFGANRERSVFERMAEFLNQRVDVTKAKAAFGGVTIEGELKNEDFRVKVRALLENDRTALRDWFHSFVRELKSAYDPMPLAVLVDGLEKYHTGEAVEVERAYRSAAAIYENFADWLRLPDVHVVYCVPPLVATMERDLRSRYDHVHSPLASVRIHRRPPDGSVCQAGFDALTEVIRKRLDPARLFGPDADECIRLIIELSGGHVRHLFQLLREAILTTLTRRKYLTVTDLQSIFASAQGAFSLPKQHTVLLSEVHQRGTFENGDLGAVARILDDYLVLAYANGEPWFDISPRGRYLLERSAPASGDV